LKTRVRVLLSFGSSCWKALRRLLNNLDSGSRFYL
jgi:hypothetical protein